MKSLILIGAFVSSPAGQPQLSETTPAVSATFQVPVADYKGIESKWSGALSVVQWWANNLARQDLAPKLYLIEEDAVKRATPIVEWTGKGVLFEIQVAINQHAGDAGFWVAEIVGDTAHEEGIGSTPESALFQAMAKPHLDANPSDDFVVDPGYSGYFWVAANPEGVISSHVVASGTIHSLKERVRLSYGELQTGLQKERLQNAEKWARIAATAQHRLSDSVSRQRVADVARLLRDSDHRVKEINERLKDALAAAQKAAKTRLLISLLSTSLDAGALAEQATASINDPSFDAKDAKSADVVLERTRTYEDSKIRLTQTLRLEMKTAVENRSRNLETLRAAIAPAVPPVAVDEELRSDAAVLSTSQ